MSKRTQTNSESPLACSECGKTFRNARTLDAHRLHTHQMEIDSDEPVAESSTRSTKYKLVPVRATDKKTEKDSVIGLDNGVESIHLYMCPECGLKYSNYMMMYRHIQAQHCIDMDGQPVEKDSPYLIQPVKVNICGKCHSEIDKNKPHTCKAASTTEVPKKSQIRCICSRMFDTQRQFDDHIPKAHNQSIECFFFPDAKYFVEWKKVMCGLTNVAYFLREGFTGRKQHWSCENARSRETACPSAIAVDNYDTGVLVTLYKDHSSHRAVRVATPPQYQQYSLRAVRPLLEATAGDLDAGAVAGMLGFVAKCAETLDRKHLRLLQGKVLDMIITFNDKLQVESEPEAKSTTRPINNMIGQRVITVSDTETESIQTPLKKPRLEETKDIADNPIKIDVFTLGRKPTTNVSKTKWRTIAPKLPYVDHAAKVKLAEIASEVEPIVKAAKANALTNTPVISPERIMRTRPSKSKYISKTPKIKPIKNLVQTLPDQLDIEEILEDRTNVKKPQSNMEPVYNTISPNVQQQNNIQPVYKTNSLIVTKPQNNIEPVYSRNSPNLSVSKSPASYVDTFKDFLQKSSVAVVKYSKDAWLDTRERVASEVNENQKSKDVLIPIEGELVPEENNTKNRSYKRPNRRNWRSRKHSTSESSSSDEEWVDPEVKSEPDYEEITVEENGFCKIEDYEVMERENDCNVLILKI